MTRLTPTQRCCNACKKRTATLECQVLTEPVGLAGPCRAWTDDPEWQDKTDKELIIYKLKKEGLNWYSPTTVDQRTCDSCKKRLGPLECAVLTEMVGLSGECWAWSNNLYWREKAQISIEIYSRKRSGLKYTPSLKEVFECMGHDAYIGGVSEDDSGDIGGYKKPKRQVRWAPQ